MTISTHTTTQTDLLCTRIECFFFQNVLGGAVFGVWVALPLVCVLTACGASLCYLLSLSFGHSIVTRYLGHRITPLQERVG